MAAATTVPEVIPPSTTAAELDEEPPQESQKPSGERPDPAKLIEPHVLAQLDPEFVEFLVDFLQKNPPPTREISIEEMRADEEKFRPSWWLDVTGYERVEDREVISEDGAKIPVKVYHPDPATFGEGPYPVHINFHGGGFVLGDLAGESALCLSMRDGAGVVVIDVNYRHCPETVWGKCFQDAWAALNWARDSANSLNIKADSVSVGGISAGAHISLVMHHWARDAGIPLKLCMATVPPSTDGLGYEDYKQSLFPSFHEFARAPVLPRARIQWFGKYCFPPDRKEEIRAMWPDWWLAPIRAPNWKGLCPLYVRTAECDPLRDEGEAYGMKAVAGGTKVTFKRYLGQPHTFMCLKALSQKRQYDLDSIAALKEAHGLH